MYDFTNLAVSNVCSYFFPSGLMAPLMLQSKILTSFFRFLDFTNLPIRKYFLTCKKKKIYFHTFNPTLELPNNPNSPRKFGVLKATQSLIHLVNLVSLITSRIEIARFGLWGLRRQYDLSGQDKIGWKEK